MPCLGQKIDRAGDSAIGGDHRQVGGGPKTHGCDQRMIEEDGGEVFGGVGDKGQRAGDAEIIPRVPFQRFGAMGRVFHRMRRMRAAKQTLPQIMGRDREQPRAKGGAILFKSKKSG